MKGDEILVFDPVVQVEGSEFVLLWNTSTGEIETYLASVLRTNVDKSNPTTATAAESAYSAWLSSSQAILQEQRTYLTARLEQERHEQIEREAGEQLAQMTPEERPSVRTLALRKMPDSQINAGLEKGSLKQKPIKASSYKLGMVYGGLLVAMFNPFAGAATAAILYKLYKARKAVEDAEREIRQTTDRQTFKEKFRRRQKYASYEDYLASDKWLIKRSLVVKRACGRCESPGCTRALDEVHHRLYPRVWGNEPIEWLDGLCEEHHREAHDKHEKIRR